MSLDARTLETLQQLQRDAESGALENADLQTIQKYSSALCNSLAFTAFTRTDHFLQICEVVRIQLLRAHVINLNEKNKFTQRLVIALTAAALLVGIPQIWFAYRADKRAEIVEEKDSKERMAQQSPKSAPNLPALQTNRPAVLPEESRATKTLPASQHSSGAQRNVKDK